MRYICFAILFPLLSCQQNKSALHSTGTSTDSTPLIETNIPTTTSLDTAEVKSWLIQTIEDFFRAPDIDMQSITTPEYYEFKTDAMNVDMGTEKSLTENEFYTKWRYKYDPYIHPIQVGFLISGQDFGSIKVPYAHVKRLDDDTKTIVFSLIIRDEDFKIDYDRDIIIISQEGKYLISDVLEYD